MKQLQVSGLAFLCFVEEETMFTGVFVGSNNRQYRLSGKVGKVPAGHFHECCFDHIPIFYDIVVSDPASMDLDDEVTLRHVMRTGGDNCSLTSDEVEFITDQLITDKKAEEYVNKYFTQDLLSKDCYVCIGQMDIAYTGQLQQLQADSPS